MAEAGDAGAGAEGGGEGGAEGKEGVFGRVVVVNCNMPLPNAVPSPFAVIMDDIEGLDVLYFPNHPYT